MTEMAGFSLNWYLIYDQNSWKTIPFGAAHTYIADLGESLPSPTPGEIVETSTFTYLDIQNREDLSGLYLKASFPSGKYIIS